jgi:hypothetical protein
MRGELVGGEWTASRLGRFTHDERGCAEVKILDRTGTIPTTLPQLVKTALMRLIVSPCRLVVRVSGYRSRGPGSIPGATRFSEK